MQWRISAAAAQALVVAGLLGQIGKQVPQVHTAVPQQIHFDVIVDDVEAVEARVLTLGAQRLSSGDGGSRVYADPAGHPFCLIPRPAWAPPIGASPGAT